MIAPIYLILIQDFLTEHNIVQLPYSLDVAHFWLFPKLKNPLKSKRFDDVKEIKRNAMKKLLVHHKK